MNDEIIKSTCPKCHQKSDFLFCWPKLVLLADGADDWVCFVCASKQLGDILAENRSLKSELQSHKTAMTRMQAQITDYEKDGPARREKYRAANPPSADYIASGGWRK